MKLAQQHGISIRFMIWRANDQDSPTLFATFKGQGPPNSLVGLVHPSTQVVDTLSSSADRPNDSTIHIYNSLMPDDPGLLRSLLPVDSGDDHSTFAAQQPPTARCAAANFSITLTGLPFPTTSLSLLPKPEGENWFKDKMWKSDRVRRILLQHSERLLGCKLNVSIWRHVAISIFNRFLGPKYLRNFGEGGTEYEDEDWIDEEASDLQAGHGTHI
ncbi:hypothetical protein E4U25_003204, partial [Claviceps purpurea]